jgi:hypothetical protein
MTIALGVVTIAGYATCSGSLVRAMTCGSEEGEKRAIVSMVLGCVLFWGAIITWACL